MKYLNFAYYIVLFFGPKIAKCKNFSQFFPKLGFYKDSKKLLGNIYGDYENTFGAYVGILSGLQKKKIRILSGLQKTPKNGYGILYGFQKKAPKSCLGIPFFFFRDSSGFFGILQDSDSYFGHICSSGCRGGRGPGPSVVTLGLTIANQE